MEKTFLHSLFLSAANGQLSAAGGNQFFQIDFEFIKTLTGQTHFAEVQSQRCWLSLAVDR
ncbi:hypothetical protein [Acidaminococcus sp. CAG:542]|jgi:hypothetical protein|uniref:hypothetical protein n=1 Tax=unclassified Acidaminococcus TaxID=2635771 RepID=UPI002589A65E|nr:hypothetical protein [Acidaminococcus sp. CAG:542]